MTPLKPAPPTQGPPPLPPATAPAWEPHPAGTWGHFVAAVLVGALAAWASLHALFAGAWEAAAGGVVVGALAAGRVFVVSVALITDWRHRLHLQAALLADFQATRASARRVYEAYGAAAYRMPDAPPPPTAVPINKWSDWGKGSEAARVSHEATETVTLVERSSLPTPAPVAYVGTDCEALMAVAFSKTAPSVSHFTRQPGWNRERYEAARDRLIGAGVLYLPGAGKAVTLTDDFAREVAGLPPDAQHEAVERWLARDPYPPSTVAA